MSDMRYELTVRRLVPKKSFDIWSNVKYNSIEHRAVTNENKCRLSFASFIVPHDDVEVEPFAHIVESHGSKRMYKKFSMKAASGGSGRSVTKYIAMWSIDFTRSIISHNSTGKPQVFVMKLFFLYAVKTTKTTYQSHSSNSQRLRLLPKQLWLC
ncbi:hypothetical protein LguiB_015619 [Lonicera macranthoides]